MSRSKNIKQYRPGNVSKISPAVIRELARSEDQPQHRRGLPRPDPGKGGQAMGFWVEKEQLDLKNRHSA
jgi:hypothetical protein